MQETDRERIDKAVDAAAANIARLKAAAEAARKAAEEASRKKAESERGSVGSG